MSSGFAVGCVWLEVFSRYERYVAILKWGSFVLLAYVATALVVDVPWGLVLYNTFVPSFSLQNDYVVAIVAVLGTTITPYCFFWQSSQEAEDERIDPAAHALIDAPEQAPAQIGRMRFDTYVGMGYSNLISLFIIVTTAATLERARHHRHPDLGPGGRGAAADRRAVHLRPVRRRHHRHRIAGGPGAGRLGAYALGEALGWPTGLDRQPLDAKAFYGTIAVSTLIGIGINFVGLDPIKALFWSAVINGVVAVPLMVVIMIMAMRAGDGRFMLPRALWAMGWLCTAVMAVGGGDHVGLVRVRGGSHREISSLKLSVASVQNQRPRP